MEWATVLKLFEVLPEIVGALVGVAGAIYGLWKSARAREWEMSSDNFEGLLSSLVAAVEMLPRDDRTKAIKQAIDRIQRYSGQYSESWVAMIKEIEVLVRSMGLNDQADDVAALSRAADAVALARAARKGKTPSVALKGGLPAVLLVVGLCACFSGCVVAGPDRLTRETVWPADGDGGYGPEIVVEWPEGVASADVRTVEIDSRVLTTAPVPD